MVSHDSTKISTTSNFMLLGESKKERLAYNGNIVSVTELKEAGIEPGPKAADRCLICSPAESKRIWCEVKIYCNDVSGSIWFCSNCSRAYRHKTRDQGIWTELLKTLQPVASYSGVHINLLSLGSSYLPSKEDFESAYRKLARPGESVSIDAVLDQIEISASRKGQFLKSDWRMITEKNIEIWAGKK